MATVKMIPPAIAVKPPALRVAAYCRVSSNSEDQQHSYAVQIRYYTEYIGQHEGWELVDIYADCGLTGTRMEKREDFNRLLADCRKGKIDKVLVKSLSRFARNTRDCLVAMRELMSLGVSIQFEKENIDTASLTSELMVSVSSSLAQEESVSISRNLRTSYHRRMERGEFITCKAPFGYRMPDGKNLEVYEPEAQVVRDIYRRYLTGESTSDIAACVSALGMRTRDGHTVWTANGINYILRNEKYIGDALCQKTLATDTFPFVKKRNEGEKDKYYVDSTHPAIIPKETFEQTQRLLKSRSRCLDGPQKRYPFTKRIICGICGCTFVRKETQTGHVAWSCLTHIQNASACPTGRIPELEICEAFVRMYNKLRKYEGVILRPALNQWKALDDAMQRDNPEMLALNRAIAEAAERSLNITKLQTAGLLDAAICTSKLRDIETELEELRRKRRNLLRNEQVEIQAEAFRQTVQVIQAGPEKLDQFDVALFLDMVESITAESKTRVRFRLYGGMELAETLREAGR